MIAFITNTLDDWLGLGLLIVVGIMLYFILPRVMPQYDPDAARCIHDVLTVSGERCERCALAEQPFNSAEKGHDG